MTCPSSLGKEKLKRGRQASSSDLLSYIVFYFFACEMTAENLFDTDLDVGGWTFPSATIAAIENI